MPELLEPAAPQPAFQSRRRIFLGLLLVLLVSSVLLAWLQTATEGLYGYDGYYHVRFARILASEGISRSFPWWQETFLKDHFADKEFLYHVLLIPFTLGDPVTGGKIAAVVFGAAAVATFFLVACALRVPWPEAWSLFLLASSSVLLYRLGFARPLVLAVALALAGTAAILLERGKWAYAFAAIYPHVHISFHLLPFVALLHDLHTRRPAGERSRTRFRMTAWTAAGAATGAILSPYVPNNLHLWWVQNIRVLGLAWAGPEGLRLGLEIQPGRSDQLLKYNAGVFAALAVAVYLLARRRRRASPQALTLLVMTAGFLGLSMLSRRFIEFWTPFTVLFAAVAVRDARSAWASSSGETDRDARDTTSRSRGRKRALAGFSALSIGALLYLSAIQARRFISEDEGLYYAGVSEWMAANIPPGETVFQSDWDDFPQLFFFNPQLRYLVGLDPTFMYVTSPERWRLWHGVTHADVEDVYTPIRETFRSRWVHAIPEAADFLALARRDPRFFVRYEDRYASILFLADGYRFVGKWQVKGWYPDAARRLFDVPIGSEPGAVREAAPDPIGPGAGGLEVNAGAGFVDLGRSLGLTRPHEACAVAEASLMSPARSKATLAVTTDDEIKVHLNGRTVLEHSPFRHPEPGSPGAPEASLDDLISSRQHVPERTASITLEEGRNALVVKTCRSGGDFGFFLRVFLPDGSAVLPP